MSTTSVLKRLSRIKQELFGLTKANPSGIDVSGTPCCGTLKTREEVKSACRAIKRLGLPLHPDRPKNWDSLAAFFVIMRYCSNKQANILDAGGELYSALLPQLESAGYKNLRCNNLVFKKDGIRKGNILYEYGDITRTSYANKYFDVVTCLSVIEHGVNIAMFFKEMSRILKIGGVLFVSTDYWCDPIDTEGKFAYGVPVHIFSAKQIANIAQIATIHGFSLSQPLDLKCNEKVVNWKQVQLDYTFIYFTLIKVR